MGDKSLEEALEGAIMAEKLAGQVSGRPVGFKARRISDSSFVVKDGHYIRQTEDGLRISNGAIHFIFSIDSGGADLTITADGEEAGGADYEADDNLIGALGHNELMLYYSSSCSEGRSWINLEGIEGKNPDISMIVKGNRFISDPQDSDAQRPAEEPVRADSIMPQEKTAGEQSQAPDLGDMIPFAAILKGYTPAYVEKSGKDVYQQPMRVAVNRSLGSRMVSKSNKIYFKPEYLGEVHAVIQSIEFRMYEWVDKDSPYAPKSVTGAASPGVSTALKAMEYRPSKSSTEAPPAAEEDPEKTEAPEETLKNAPKAVHSTVEDAVKQGDARLEDAVNRLLPKRKGENEQVKGLRESMMKYSLNSAGMKKFIYTFGVEPLVKKETVRDFYNEVVERFLPEIKSLKMLNALEVGSHDPDPVFRPADVDGLYSFITGIVKQYKGSVTEFTLDDELKSAGREKDISFSHLDSLRVLALNIYRMKTRYARPISRRDAIDLLKDNDIKDAELLLREREKGLLVGEHHYNGEKVVRLAMMTKFNMENPHIFYRWGGIEDVVENSREAEPFGIIEWGRVRDNIINNNHMGTPFATSNKAISELNYRYNLIITEGMLDKVCTEFNLYIKQGDKQYLFDTMLKAAVRHGIFDEAEKRGLIETKKTRT